MDIKNQQGDHVAKQKNVQKENPRKIMQQQIQELSTMMSMCIQKITQQQQLISSIEEIILKLSEYLGKKEGFEEYLEEWIKEETAKKEKEEPKE